MPWFRQTPTWDSPHLGPGRPEYGLLIDGVATKTTRHQQVKHREISSDLELYHISVNPTNSRVPMPESGSAAQTCHSVLLTWVVSHTRSAVSHVSMILILYVQKTTEMYAKTVLKTQQTTECKQLLPETPCKRHVQIVRSWAEILHFLAWRIEEICMCCTAPPKSAADACEDVDGNDVGLCVAVLSRLGSRNLNAPGTSLLSDRTHTCKILQDN